VPDTSDQPDAYPADRSLVEVLAELAGLGFDASFDVDDDDGWCTCSACDTRSSPDDIGFEQRRRLEGASDPAEMANVLALRCPHCSAGGVAVCRFGSEASAGEAILMRAVSGRIEQ
jgi:hypothetical protein